MAKLLRMPEVAANATEAILQSWALAENAEYAVLDTIATIETEKAVVDIDAEEAGVLLKTLVEAGASVETGTPIALLGSPGEQVANIAAALAELGVDAAPQVPATGATTPEPTVAAQVIATPTSASAAEEPAANTGGRIFASPLARRLAREAGLEAATITGTGPDGRILRRDVEAAVARPAPSVAPPAPGVAPTPAATPVPTTIPAALKAAVPAVRAAGFTEIPHTRMRRAIARRLVESKTAVPHFYLRAACRVDALMAVREQLNAISPTRISVNDFVIKAVAWSHVLVPGMNVTWTDDAMRQYESVDVAIAVATEKGLVTPVLRGVERTPIAAIAAASKDFASRAREGQLRQDELEGGSISVSNLGMFGTEDFAAIINPPQAAILAVGAARPAAVVVDGELTVATVIRVTLSVDHRSVDGALGAEWLRTFVGLIENPIQILA
jgi:pyruvate dehydrogenase E2 component (dihydrolipoamide acetyltransferase)